MNPHNDLDTPTGQREGKALETLVAAYALAGIDLIKSDPEISRQAPDYAVRHNLWQPLDDLDAAREFLARMSDTTRDVEELQA